MRVLVTGATGFVGSHLVPALLEAGHQVRALTRGRSDAGLPSGVEVARGSMTDLDSMRAAAEGCEACVHLVAVIVEHGGQTFYRINHRGTEDVIRALDEAAVPRLIHVSALGVREGLERFPYLHSKWLGEEAVRRAPLAWTILRPGALFGEGAGFFRPIVWSLRWMPVYPLPKGGRTRFQPFAVEDLARCVVSCLEGTHVDETVEIGGPEILTFREVVQVVADALGKKRRMMSVPLLGARAFAWLQELRQNPLVTNRQLSMIVLDNVTDTDAVPRAFGFEPQRLADADLRWLARL